MLSWEYSHTNKMTYKHRKLGHSHLVLFCDQRSSVGLCMHDYESVRVAIIICANPD